MIDIGILDQSVKRIGEFLAELEPTAEDIAALIEAEQAGKTRAGAIALLESFLPAEVIEPVEEDEPHDVVTITNDKPGTTLHLGDGRRLAFGESAEVPAYLASAFNG